MAGFLYYLPRVMVVTADEVKRVGIRAVDKIDNIGFCQVEKGPDGGAGVIFAASAETEAGSLPKIGMYAAAQRWTECNGGQFWLGVETAKPPTPADLQRAELVAGHEITLDDGRAWTVPVARAFGRGSSLPHALVLGPNGELVAEALPKFAALSQQAERVFEAFLNNGEDLTIKQCWEIAASALGQNYRVTGWELSALRVLNTDNVQTVLGHLIDLPAIIEAAKAQKKSQLELDSLSAGQAD